MTAAHAEQPAAVEPLAPDAPLTAADLEVLEFERTRFRSPGEKENAIRDRFADSPTRYYLRLLRILRNPNALLYDPTLVHRLQRIRSAEGQRRNNRR